MITNQEQKEAPIESVVNTISRDRSWKVVKLDYSMSGENQKKLKEFYGKHFDLKFPTPSEVKERFTSLHPHPLLASDRYIAEKIAINLARSKMADFKYDGPIGDIGSGVRSITRVDGMDIHALMPILTSNDYQRYERLRRGHYGSVCQHTMQDCACQTFSCFISIHSIYYLTVEDISAALSRTQSRTMFVVCHEFDGNNGQFPLKGLPEAKWRSDGIRLQMNVIGNNTPYVHSLPTWLNNNIETITDMGQLVVTVKSTTMFSTIYEVTYVPFMCLVGDVDLDDYDKELKLKQEKNKMLKDMQSKQLENEAFLKQFTAANITYRKLTTYKNHVVYINDKQSTLLLPTRVLRQAIRRVTGEVRNTKTFASQLEYIKRLMNDDTYIDRYDNIGEIIMAIACYSFTVNVQFETGVFHQLSTWSSTFKFHELISDFSKTLPYYDMAWLILYTVLNFLYVIVVAIGTIDNSYVNIIVKILKLLPCTFVIVTVFTYDHTNQAFYLFTISIIYQYFLLPYMPYILIFAVEFVRLFHLFYFYYDTEVYGTNMSNNIVDPRNGPGSPKWGPSDLIVTSIESGKTLSKTRSDTQIKTKIENYGSECRNNTISVGFIVRYYPTIHQPNFTNELIAVTNRECAMRNFEITQESLENLFVILYDLMNGGVLPNSKMTQTIRFDDWNNRYPKTQRERHLIAYNDTPPKPFQLFWKKAFIKVERLLGYDHNGDFKDKNPRLIQGCTDHYNVVVGPQMLDFSKLLVSYWDGVKTPILYTSTYSGEQVSEFYNQYAFNNEFVIIEDDATLYDMHMTEHLELTYALYEAVFYNKKALKYIKESLHKYGATPHGVRYKTKYTRSSGEPDTSVGNSIINVIMHLSLFPNPVELLKSKKIAIIVLGDDILLFVHKSLNPDVNVYRNKLHDLGMDVKIKITDRYNAEFCSCKFWLIDDDRALIGPKPGRLLVKLGWATNITFKDRYSKMRHIKGVALGLRDSVNHIPVLCNLIDNILRITSNIPSKSETNKFHFSISKPHDMTRHTLDQFNEVYGTSTSAYLEFVEKLKTVDSLPYQIDSAFTDQLVKVDCQ